MPKVPAGPASKTKKSSKASSSSKSSVPKLYSNFLPLPLLLPSPTPVPSSSSKPLTQVEHFIYCRSHQGKFKGKSAGAGATDGEGELPEGRTVFVVNLPVDITERDLRTVFGKWGVVEDVRIAGKDGGDVLEGAVKGLPVEEDEESSDDDDEEDEEEAEVEDEEEEVARAEATFKGDGLLSKKQRKALRRKNAALPASVPTITPLPALSPRSTPFTQSGLSSAHLIFLDPISLSRLFSSSSASTAPIPLPKYASEPTGLAYYTLRHSALRPPLSAVKAFSDSSMARFDHLHSLLLASRAREQGAGALVDEDGFTVVVRSGRYGRAGGRGDGTGNQGVGVATRGFEKKKEGKKKSLGASELPNFYKFQTMDRKRQELAELRSKFEQDKAKVEELKKSRRYKPY
ncbi:hypothetical protein IAT38_001830 [Cryptococcus sp. DSM 104549]